MISLTAKLFQFTQKNGSMITVRKQSENATKPKLKQYIH